jgi:hypothetical protein
MAQLNQNQGTMTRTSTQVGNRIASLALAVTDLRAHFEAQLRSVARAEEALMKCRTARDSAAVTSAATALRNEIRVVSDNNRSVRAVIDQMDVDACQLVVPGRK